MTSHSGEDPEEFEALLRGFEQHYQPTGSLKQALVERITHCAWRLQRAGVIKTTLMSRGHWQLECERARAEMERANRNMDSIESAFKDDSDGDDAEEDEPDEDHNLPPEKAEALWRDYEREEKALNKAREVCERVKEELKSLSCGVDHIFLRTQKDLERLSRYEITIERQLRNAMQDIERIQAARIAEAAQSATVINVTDLKEEAG